MSIYISGMKLPPKECRVIIAVDGDGTVYRMTKDEFLASLERSSTTIQLMDPPYTELLNGIMSALQDIACILQKIAEKEDAP